MKGVLLAAGLGTRLRPVTGSRPKILAPIGDRSLLEWQLRFLARSGVTAVAVNVHHEYEQVAEALDRLQEGSGLPELTISYEEELLGTAGALMPLRSFLDEPFVVLYGDVVTDLPLAELMRAHRSAGALATLACYESEETSGKGVLELRDDGTVARFVEKADTADPGLVNAGIYAADPALVDIVPAGFADFGHDVWPEAIEAGARLLGYPIDCYLRDIGTPEGLRKVSEDVADGTLTW